MHVSFVPPTQEWLPMLAYASAWNKTVQIRRRSQALITLYGMKLSRLISYEVKRIYRCKFKMYKQTVNAKSSARSR